MNPRLEGIIMRFAENKGLNGDLPTLNEHFANYVILLDEYYKQNGEYPFDSDVDLQLLESLNFGKNKTESIDGFFCITENSRNIIHIESTHEEIEESVKSLKKVNMSVVLIQSKVSKFDTKDSLSLQVRLKMMSEEQENWKRFFDFRNNIIKKLYTNNPLFSVKFTVIYFSGEKIDDQLLNNENFLYKVNGLKEAMKECFWINNDSDIAVKFYDGQSLMELYDIQSKTTEAVSKIVELHQLTDAVKCGELAEMRLGSIKIKQLKEILYDSTLKRPHQLYEYNVRHNLDQTGPNEKMTVTLTDEIENFKFPLLNNGITMIVDSMSRKGDRALELNNIRIVNGCQTSHVILKNCIEVDKYDDVLVPIKVISTKNEDILSEITFSSNNQNPIKSENLISLNKKIMFLEKEYMEFSLIHERNLSDKYYFERRQGQHSGLNKDFVIDIPLQSKVFNASWLIKPHLVLQYKDQTLTSYNDLINQFEDQELKSFYTLSILSGIIWCKIYEKIKGSNYEQARYHILCSVIFSSINVTDKEYLNLDDKSKLSVCMGKIRIIEDRLLGFLFDLPSLYAEIDRIKAIIDSLNEDLPKNSKGGIHYRKFYPNKVINMILERV